MIFVNNVVVEFWALVLFSVGSFIVLIVLCVVWELWFVFVCFGGLWLVFKVLLLVWLLFGVLCKNCYMM